MEAKAENYQGIAKVKEVTGEATANKHLADGWVLLHIYTMNRGEGLQGDNFSKYILGMKKESE